MRNKYLISACLVALALPLAACNEQATQTAGQDFGGSPKWVERGGDELSGDSF